MKIKVLVGNRFVKDNEEVTLYSLDHFPVLLVESYGNKFSIHASNTDFPSNDKHVLMPDNLARAWQEMKGRLELLYPND